MTAARGWSALVGASMLLLLAVYITTAMRVGAVDSAGRTGLLDASGVPATARFDIAPSTVRVSMVADPLSQRLVNAAMISSATARAGSLASSWFDALSRLGWRDTTSRQNLLIHHAQQGDVPAVLDDIDGLLRRNLLIDQISPVLLAMEGDPAWRGRVVERLRQRPAWRFGYLQRGSLIDAADMLAARATTIRALQRSGDDVAVAEIAPVLPKLLAAGLGEQAFVVWQAREPFITRPVADPVFAKLAAEREPSAVPFHWQLTNGPDYSVYAVSRPTSYLSLSWNGAGAPVFAAQTLSAPAGRYQVILTTADARAVESTIGVRMVCGNDAIDFAHVRRLSPSRVAYSGERPVPCAFARLELFGRSGTAGLHDHQAAVSSVAIASII